MIPEPKKIKKTEEKVVKLTKTLYQTSDGKEFEYENDAIDHEFYLNYREVNDETTDIFSERYRFTLGEMKAIIDGLIEDFGEDSLFQIGKSLSSYDWIDGVFIFEKVK